MHSTCCVCHSLVKYSGESTQPYNDERRVQPSLVCCSVEETSRDRTYRKAGKQCGVQDIKFTSATSPVNPSLLNFLTPGVVNDCRLKSTMDREIEVQAHEPAMRAQRRELRAQAVLHNTTTPVDVEHPVASSHTSNRASHDPARTSSSRSSRSSARRSSGRHSIAPHTYLKLFGLISR